MTTIPSSLPRTELFHEMGDFQCSNWTVSLKLGQLIDPIITPQQKATELGVIELNRKS